MSFTSELTERVRANGVIAVLVIDRAADAVPVARALLDGGIAGMELTLRTPAALDALKEIRKHVPEMLAGIGTILTVDQVKQVKDAGGAFGVSPGTNPKIVREAQKLGLPFAPGIVTPSDVEQALECGCKLLKFFPAEPSGGLSYLKAMAAPYVHLGVKFIPLGGVNASNAKAYLQDSLILSLGGSWLAPREVIQKQDWAAITAVAKEASGIVKEVRSNK
jgi:2-dehydro-3-deoxyphosphogluconate aldolase/(4S)-4-hydroxy-2-oxoglutarate aldolase